MIKLLLLFFFLSSPLISEAQTEIYTPLFWEQNISQALSSRDMFYQKLGVGPHANRLRDLLRRRESKQLRQQLREHENRNSPWFHFLFGLSYLQDDKERAAFHFQRALDISETDPGITWVLFIEFDMTDNSLWAEKSLHLLEKQKILAGAQSAPVISQQLLFLAQNSTTAGEATVDYPAWSSRFERYPLWQQLSEARQTLFIAPLTALRAFLGSAATLSKSWYFQLTTARYLYLVVRAAALAFVLMVLFSLSVHTVPSALHPLVELFPQIIPYSLRLSLSILLYLSLAALGLIPFLFVHTLLIWPFLQRRGHAMLIVSTSLLLLGPLDARLQSFFTNSLSPHGSVGLYHEAINGGYSPELASALVHAIEQNPRDHLLQMSAAILSYKKGDFGTALHYISKAEQIKSSDPVQLITAGNIYFAQGNLKKADTYYQDCINTFPTYEEGFFNLGQYNFASMQTMRGTELIAQAADINDSRVNSFIEKNDVLFANQWPMIRKVMQADYKPAYFWTQITTQPQQWGSWKQASSIWSARFIGLPPLVFYPIMLIAAFFVFRKRPKRMKSIFYCRLCGKTMCKKCRNGMLCADCVSRLQIGRETSEDTKKVESHITKRRRVVAALRGRCAGAFFPGSDILLNPLKKGPGILLMIVSSFIYAFYAMVTSFNFSYPYWVVEPLFTGILIFCLLYSVSFLGYAVWGTIKDISGEKIHVN